MGESFTLTKRIGMARTKHGDKYDYSLWPTGLKAKSIVTTICGLHGEFSHNVDSHCRGVGCPTCKGGVQLTKNERLIQFKAKHGDKYDYSFVGDDVTAFGKIEILCWVHGMFTQAAGDHAGGAGCPKCSGKYQFTSQERIVQCNMMHKSRYDYSLFPNKVSLKSRLKIICPLHGVFKQTLHGHLSGRGCADCARSGFKKTQKGFLYFLKSGEIIKVGITNKPKQRIGQLNRATPFKFEVFVMFQHSDGEIIADLERQIHKNTVSAELKGFDGATEWRRVTPTLISLLDLPILYGAELCQFN